MDLYKKKVLITGASGFLGKNLVKNILNLGGIPICCGTSLIKIEKELSKILESYQEEKDYYLFSLNLESDDSIRNLVESLSEYDILPNGIIANASNRNFNLTEEFKSISYYHKFFNVDSVGHLLLSQQIIEKYKQTGDLYEQGLSIVMVSSIYAMNGPDYQIYPPGIAATPIEYCISKSSQRGLVKALASEHGSDNVRVNSIISGGIINNQNLEFIKNYEAKTMLGRMAKPDEISQSICFLISDSSSYITATEMIVDGGFTSN